MCLFTNVAMVTHKSYWGKGEEKELLYGAGRSGRRPPPPPGSLHENGPNHVLDHCVF